MSEWSWIGMNTSKSNVNEKLIVIQLSWQPEVVFKSGDMNELFEDDGNFKGSVSLVDTNGLILEDNVTTMRDANAYFNEQEDEWQREHEMALSFFSTDIPEGSKFYLNLTSPMKKHWKLDSSYLRTTCSFRSLG